MNAEKLRRAVERLEKVNAREPKRPSPWASIRQLEKYVVRVAAWTENLNAAIAVVRAEVGP